VTARTTVINIKSGAPYDVYIGRRNRFAPPDKPGNDGYFGNPHHLISEAERDRAVEEYRADFLRRVESDPVFRRRVLMLRGQRLGCFCKPRACHGDVIAEWVDVQPDPKSHLPFAGADQSEVQLGTPPGLLGQSARRDALTERIWSLFVQRDTQGRYQVTCRASPLMQTAGAFKIVVAGEKEPEIPAEAVSYADLLRWQVRLIDTGYDVGEPEYH
jgi:Domain of unknown function (DUF4326)